MKAIETKTCVFSCPQVEEFIYEKFTLIKCGFKFNCYLKLGTSARMEMLIYELISLNIYSLFSYVHIPICFIFYFKLTLNKKCFVILLLSNKCDFTKLNININICFLILILYVGVVFVSSLCGFFITYLCGFVGK